MGFIVTPAAGVDRQCHKVYLEHRCFHGEDVGTEHPLSALVQCTANDEMQFPHESMFSQKGKGSVSLVEDITKTVLVHDTFPLHYHLPAALNIRIKCSRIFIVTCDISYKCAAEKHRCNPQ